jgi:hypothetical protein
VKQVALEENEKLKREAWAASKAAAAKAKTRKTRKKPKTKTNAEELVSEVLVFEHVKDAPNGVVLDNEFAEATSEIASVCLTKRDRDELENPENDTSIPTGLLDPPKKKSRIGRAVRLPVKYL